MDNKTKTINSSIKKFTLYSVWNIVMVNTSHDIQEILWNQLNNLRQESIWENIISLYINKKGIITDE